MYGIGLQHTTAHQSTDKNTVPDVNYSFELEAEKKSRKEIFSERKVIRAQRFLLG